MNLPLRCQEKTPSENVICLCRLLHLLANFSNIFAYISSYNQIFDYCAGTEATFTLVGPFQIAGLVHAWQISHQISTISIMRVDSRELPLSAIPLCQLLPCHLGLPKPTLSLSLYVKGCLDSTIGAFHMSIPAEPSLLQNEVQILNAKPRK